MANATCGPVYVLDTTGTVQNCDRTFLVQSVAWSGHNGVLGTAQLEDGFGRVIYYERSACTTFRAYTFSVPANGLVLRTLLSGTTLYVQVGS